MHMKNIVHQVEHPKVYHGPNYPHDTEFEEPDQLLTFFHHQDR